jgi:hypothetical protein
MCYGRHRDRVSSLLTAVWSFSLTGNFKAEAFNPNTNSYAPDSNVGVTVTVEETFDNNHRVVNQKGSDKGRFTFSAAQGGQHRLCFMPEQRGSGGGWLSHAGGPVKLTLDMVIGENSDIESEDKGKMENMVNRVKSLNARLHDIRREQIFQRVRKKIPLFKNPQHWPMLTSPLPPQQEREAQFRDQSELTNSRVVRWSMIQIAVLVATCAWQLSHLRAFFIKQKLT